MTPIFAIAWRGIGRNRRRSFLTAGAISFAVFLIVFALGMQAGGYKGMIEHATGLLTGHIQLQYPGFQENPAIADVLPDAPRLAARVASIAGVKAVAARAMIVAVLSSSQERSAVAQVFGVDPQQELQVARLAEFVTTGRYLNTQDGAGTEILIGALLANNLGAQIGDDLAILGQDRDGGVAAMTAQIVGLLESGQDELDRSLALIPLPALQEAFALGDAVHSLVIVAEDIDIVAPLAEHIGAVLADETEVDVLDWQRLLPGLQQAIELDRVSDNIFLGLLAFMITLSIANSFLMTVLERTPEFGVMMSIGCKPRLILGILQSEALFLCGIGVLVGLLLGYVILLYGSYVGISFGEEAGELLRSLHVPDRFYPVFTPVALVVAPGFMLVATQIASLIPALRVRRMDPVQALRDH